MQISTNNGNVFNTNRYIHKIIIHVVYCCIFKYISATSYNFYIFKLMSSFTSMIVIVISRAA